MHTNITPPTIRSSFIIVDIHENMHSSEVSVWKKFGLVIALILFIIPILLRDAVVACVKDFVRAAIVTKDLMDKVKAIAINVVNDEELMDTIFDRVAEISSNKLRKHEIATALYHMVKTSASPVVKNFVLKKTKPNKELIPVLLEKVMVNIKQEIPLLLQTLTSSFPDIINDSIFHSFIDFDFIQRSLNKIIKGKFNAGEKLYSRLKLKIMNLPFAKKDKELRNFILFQVYKTIKEATKLKVPSTIFASNKNPLKVLGKSSPRWKEIETTYLSQKNK